MRKLSGICLLLSLLTFTFSPPSFAVVLNFDDLPYGNAIPLNAYKGFNCTNFYSNLYDYYNSNWSNSLSPVSPDHFAYNFIGSVASMTKTSANNFIFNGAYLTSWAQDDLPYSGGASSLKIEGSLGGNLVYTHTVNLTVDSNMAYQTGWSNPVDTLVFTPIASGKFFLMDNFDYTEVSSVPEPSTFILLGAGISGLALLKRKSKKQ